MSEEILADELPNTKNNSDEDLPELIVKICPNCTEVLTGRFCMACGQKDFNMLRPFWALLEDTLGDLFSFDSRFFGTVIPLFLRPGYITCEFNRGRRAKFVPPFRQYLVISIVFFLLLVSFDIQLFNTEDIKLDKSGDIVATDINEVPSQQEAQNQISLKDKEKQTQSVDKILDEVADDMTKSRTEKMKDATDTEKEFYDSTVGFIGGLKKVWLDPKLLNVVLADWIPKMMFLMLPIFALILKLIYIRRKKFYIEHLVFSMHYHAFLFLLFTFMLLLYQFMPMSHAYLSYLFWYVPIYLFFAMWKVYGQGPIKTFLKGIFLSFTYFIFISIGLSIAIGYGLSKV